MKLEMTIKPGYAQAITDDVQACLREFFQNHRDGAIRGHRSEMRYDEAKQTLKLVNHGVALPCSGERSILLLGETDKQAREDEAGEKGEGLTLAIMGLVQMGHDVTFRTGNEKWRAEITPSKVFSSDTLKIDVTKAKAFVERFEVIITKVTPEMYADACSRCLWIDEPEEGTEINVDRGSILTGSRFEGKLFAKGIYVGDLPGDYAYGYDLPVKLDRDRKLADPWDLNWEVARALREAVRSDLIPADEVLQLIESRPSSGEGRVFVGEVARGYNDAFHKKIAAAFAARHGADTVPVTSTAQSADAEHHGLRAVVTSEAAAAIVEVANGSFASKKAARALEAEKVYAYGELDEEERATFTRAIELLQVALPQFEAARVSVVDFVGKRVKGTHNADTKAIRLARKVLKKRTGTLATLVHEVAHDVAGDGQVLHREAIEEIMAAIVCGTAW